VLPSKTQHIIDAFKIAFSYFLYAEIIEVLNTNTNAAGIITHTGFTGSNSPNIQQNESWERRNLLELKAYETIRKYLTPTAYLRYQELKTWDDLRRAGNSLAQRQLMSNSAGNTKATLI
jgi:predicted component of type VI protein secretion system